MAVTVNGVAPTAPQIADFQTTFQVVPTSHVGAGATAHANAVAGGAAGFMTGADKTKLDGIAAGATANSADATLLARANHTGTQAQSTITNLTTDLAAKAPLASPTFTGTVTLPAGTVVNGVTLTTAGGTTNFLRADGTYAAPAGGGTVTSVAMTLPTGLSVSGSPITGAGTFAVTLTSGYVIPTQATLDDKLSSSAATTISATKAVLVAADKFISIDSAASDVPKLTRLDELNNSLARLAPGTALGTTGTVNLDLAALAGTLQTITLTGNPTFTTSNRAAGLRMELRLDAGGATRTITWPSWVAYGAALPTSLASGKVLTVAIRCTGTTDGSIDATSALSV